MQTRSASTNIDEPHYVIYSHFGTEGKRSGCKRAIVVE